MGRAKLVETLLTGLRDLSGNPLSGGKVYTYLAGTTTNKTTYQDRLKAASHANPIILDAYGRKQVYADGLYKFRVDDENDNTLYTWDNLPYFFEDSITENGGTSTGAANVYAVTLSPAPSEYAEGLRVIFKAHQTSSSTTPTLNANGLGAVTLKGPSGSALAVGDIISGTQYEATYTTASGGGFILNEIYATVAQIQNGAYFYGGTSGGSANAQTVTLTPVLGSYSAGQKFAFFAGFSNTGACTINFNGLGAKNIYKYTHAVALTAGDIVAGQIVVVVYDGTQFRLESPSTVLNRTTSTSTFSNSATETDIYSFTVPANLIGTGKHLRLWLDTQLANVSGGTLTGTVRVYFGGTKIAEATAISVTNGNTFGVQVVSRVQAAYATNAQLTATEICSISNTNGSPGTALQALAVHNTVAVDTTAAAIFKVTMELSSATLNFGCQTYGAILELL